MASGWLRAAKRTASKRALTVALAFVLAFPSLNAPRYPGGAIEGGGGAPAGGSGGGAPIVELVLPSESSVAVQPAERVAETGGAQGLARSSSAQRGGFGAGRAAGSRAAFVGPWGEEAGGGSVQQRGVLATAVKAPLRRGAKGASSTVKETPKEALVSVVTSMGENGREIAEEFGGHIKV